MKKTYIFAVLGFIIFVMVALFAIKIRWPAGNADNIAGESYFVRRTSENIDLIIFVHGVLGGRDTWQGVNFFFGRKN